MSAIDILRSFAETHCADDEIVRDGITYRVCREVVAENARLKAEVGRLAADNARWQNGLRRLQEQPQGDRCHERVPRRRCPVGLDLATLGDCQSCTVRYTWYLEEETP